MYGIFTYIWLDFMVNLGQYIPYIDCMGMQEHVCLLGICLVKTC